MSINIGVYWSTYKTSTADMLLQHQKEVQLQHRPLGPILNTKDRLCAQLYSIFSCAKDIELSETSSSSDAVLWGPHEQRNSSAGLSCTQQEWKAVFQYKD